MKSLPCIAAALLAGTTIGCHALPPLRYYSLATASPHSTGHPVVPMLIRVRHVSVPHEMDHLGLTHRLGPTQLTISDTEQWTAPLNTLIQGTITRDLGERLGFEQVIAADALPLGSHPGAPQATLDLDFVALTADESCGITAQVNWTLSTPNGAPRHGTVPLSAAATACPAGLPIALSTALGELADQLVQSLTSS